MASFGGMAEQPAFSLDVAREHFYVAQRACERFSVQLKQVLDVLNEKKPDDSWLELVQDEATKAMYFHSQQSDAWTAFSSRTEDYIESVKRLAEDMAIAELKGLDATADSDVPENRARIVHPELQRFKLEKQARILGKVGGVPALGPGVALPQLQKGNILRATGSAAAREIHFSKVEDKDSRYLAEVFQFKQKKKDAVDADTTSPAGLTPDRQKQHSATPWAQELADRGKSHLGVTAPEVAEEAARRSLAAAGPYGSELSGALQQRRAHLQVQEDQEAAAAASSFLRKGSEAKGLGDASAELAEKLKRRQAEAAAAAAAAKREEEEASSGGGAAVRIGPGAAPFGGELAALLQKRQAAKQEAEANAPVQAQHSSVPSIGTSASNELADRLRKRQTMLEQQEQ